MSNIQNIRKERHTNETSAISLCGVENEMLETKQAECPVYHRFAPGLYVREVHLPTGAFVIGHYQKFPHLNVMLSGKVAMVTGNGDVSILNAPFFSVGEPGRKAGYIIEKTVWLNIYATNETEIETLEKIYLDKSDDFFEREKREFMFEKAIREDDRDDYFAMLAELNISEVQARAQSEATNDIIDMPFERRDSYSLRESPIEGRGVFASRPFAAGELIGEARIGGKRTDFGRFVNHARIPNCRFEFSGDNILLYAIRDISGCRGGGHGEELTVNYRGTLCQR